MKSLIIPALLFAPALLCAQSYLNLDFETATYTVPSGWDLSYGPFSYALDTSTTYASTQSLRIASLSSSTTQSASVSLNLSAAPADGQTLHLSGAIRTQGVNGSAALWAGAYDLDYNTLAYVDLGSLAPAGTTGWQVYNVTLVVPGGAAYVDFGVSLNGTGTAWFDDLNIDVDGNSYFPNPATDQIQWIQANAIPFTSLDPNADFTELQPLKPVIGSAQIVGIGEATHGTSEIFKMKSRLISFLAHQMGFTVFAMEANMPEAYRINNYLMTGIGDPQQLLLGMYFWTWNTQEVLDMIQWMRQYNASGQGTIQFLGFDMQYPDVAMDYVTRFVRQADPGLLSSVNSAYSLVGTLNLPESATSSNLPQYQAALTAADNILQQLQANRSQYLETTSAGEVDWAIQNATIVVQAVQLGASGASTFRDASMAANVEWIAAHAPPGSHIVLWAHNYHIQKGSPSMGSGLARYFGPNYFNLGSTFHSGMYRAVGTDGFGNYLALGTFPALDSFPGSAEYFFHETGTPQQILDLRLANANDPASSWLPGELEFRDNMGAVEVDGIAEFYGTWLPQEFDALVFFDQTTASAELPYTNMNLTVFAPVVAPQGTLGPPYVGAPASGTATPLPSALIAVSYNQTLMAGGGVWPYGSWTVAGGALPAGLSLSTDGVLSGTPTEAGSFPFAVKVTDASNNRALGQLALTVTAFATVSSTAGQVEPFAAESIVSVYGSNLATGTAAATAVPLPTSLDGTTVTVTDSAGVARPAPLFYVSPTQINYEIPEGTAPGTATVTITNQNGVRQTSTIQVGNVSPGLFVLDSAGLVAAWVLPIVSGVQQNLLPVYQVNTTGSMVPLPINVSAPGTQFYLEMYGTGIRNASSVTVTVGGVSVPVLYHDAAPEFAGLDQVNIGPIPISLAGQGNANIVLTADGKAANTVNVEIQ